MKLIGYNIQKLTTNTTAGETRTREKGKWRWWWVGERGWLDQRGGRKGGTEGGALICKHAGHQALTIFSQYRGINLIKTKIPQSQKINDLHYTNYFTSILLQRSVISYELRYTW
jgi:hypothetical protein